MFVCQFRRYRYKCPPFGVAPAGNMFQRKIYEIFNDMPNVLGITDDILVLGYKDGVRDHHKTVQSVLQRYRKVSLKLIKDKCYFKCTYLLFYGEVISRYGVQSDPQKIKALMDMPPPNNKKELQDFMGIINYPSKFSPSTVSICEPL